MKKNIKPSIKFFELLVFDEVIETWYTISQSKEKKYYCYKDSWRLLWDCIHACFKNSAIINIQPILKPPKSEELKSDDFYTAKITLNIPKENSTSDTYVVLVQG